MRKHVWKLAVVVLLAVAIPMASASFSYYQYFYIQNTGYWTFLEWNTTTGAGNYTSSYGANWVFASLPYYNWYIFALYDYTYARWDDFIWSYRTVY